MANRRLKPPEPAPTSPRLRLRVRDAAGYLGVAVSTLLSRPWRERHEIPTIRIGRALIFDRGDLDAWLARHRHNGSQHP